MAETIYFNGKKYDSVAEMPSSVREKYEKFERLFEDANRDGIPDFVQPSGLSDLKDTFNLLKEIGQIAGAAGVDPNQVVIVRETDMGIYVNGKGYNSVEEMPSEIRKAYEQVTSTANVDGSDIFDEAWREVEREEFFKPHDDEILNLEMNGDTQTTNDTIESVDSTSRFILLVVAALLVLGIAVVAWLYFFAL